jgi:hypothetical protein
MAAQVKVTFKQDLTEPVKIRHYEGVVFTGDDCGNLVKVALFDGGVPYSGGGTVSATAVLADGTTFPLTQGSITGNMVSVPLEAGALAVSGLMGLYVKISGDSIICTVLNAIFTVQATDTGMVPAATVTTVNELVATIRDAQDSFPADLTNLLAAVAPTFSTSVAYSAGAYVWQGGKLYRFTAAHPAGTWTGTDAVDVALGNDVADLKSAINRDLYTENTYANQFVSGKWSVSNGNASTDAKVIKSLKYFPTNYAENAVAVDIKSGYEFSVLCWDGDTYMGSWTGSRFNKSSNKFWRERVYLANIGGSNYKFALNVRNIDTTQTIDASEANNVLFVLPVISGKLDKYQASAESGRVMQISDDGEIVPGVKIDDYLPSKIKIFELSEMSTGKYIQSVTVGTDWTTKLVSGSGVYLPSAIDVSKYIGDTITIAIGTNDSHTGVRQIGFCNGQNITSIAYKEADLEFVESGNYLETTIPISNTHMFFSLSTKSYLAVYVNSSGEIARLVSNDVAFVSANGNDNNSGIESSPFATVNHAIESGARMICVTGGTYEQRISLTNAKHGNISIVNATPTEKVVFIDPSSLITETETQVSGYTKVYSATISKSFSTGNKWIFQDGIPDATTEITAAKRMSEQRGLLYRCYDTKIEQAAADNLSDALSEIENSESYKWYIDGTTLYFSRPETVTANNPIRGSFNRTLFSGYSRKLSLHIVGIDVKYMAFNVRDTSNSRIVDCSVSNVFGEGGFKFDGSDGIEFIRCEASRVYSGSNGDGFNAHSLNTGDAFAHQTTAVLIDCWSHDNSDDGISLHERSEFTVIGGLFEQNMYGGGVTPANGSHCTCYNVYARDNGDGGFLYMNPTSAAEGGVGGQIKCIGCVSESNDINADAIKGGYKVMSAGNMAILISCKAINEPRGYYVADNDGAMLLIDCGAYNCTEIKGGKVANIIAQNTTLVS